MGRDQKKQAKQKKREQKNALAKKYADGVKRERRRREQYPKILFDSAEGNPEFVEAVRSAVAKLDFDDKNLFSAGERTFYKHVREAGFQFARNVLQQNMDQLLDEGDQFGRVGESVILMGYGSKLLMQIPESHRRRLMPYNDVQVLFKRRDIVLKFTSMLSQRGDHGTVYFGRRKPTIEMDGEQKVVAFSHHAIERICERLNPRYIQYAAAGDVHAFFSTCVYFEPVTLHGGQPAFVLYDMCFDDEYLRYDTYVRKILGEENLDSSLGKTYFRVGYCPVVFEGEFAKAKTFLYPGYTTTPEYGLILRSSLSRSEREVLLQDTRSLDAEKVVVNDNPETIKWFHDNGVPQVVHIKQDVFVP